MKNNMVITIGRQYGSGGREIGEKLAERLGYEYYDTQILEKAADEAHLTEAILKRYDEKLKDGWLNTSIWASGNTDIHHLPVPLKAAIGQFEAIRKIGRKGAAVIVGRCADYVLKEQKNVFSVFIHADMKQRAVRVAKRNNMKESDARKRIRSIDKERASYYNYYTEKEWGACASYNLSIDSGVFGIDGTVEIIENCLRSMQ
ncbi:MAG: cytidylate kinase-like family protein [Lachnospiraceae bacterium]|nr:cytidylate kinase-like family protein [Lachnospiraceae bacterium]